MVQLMLVFLRPRALFRTFFRETVQRLGAEGYATPEPNNDMTLAISLRKMLQKSYLIYNCCIDLSA